ncbi:Fumipyrrole biosynthesis protein C [Colletotrichum orbiculare MAFF 240422]|uniref:Fumipyrrole biosynthesis protein C n=1 Tax=Colletotrichum orbiculare (strain 104-T / ATCC 96160 / CBS 514.97 / LARS 414 / MAFF 240422) TaxID=1213857 RepID=N4VLN8_COLOR|nr:Fumipyrrole biosynthesis protein C [Colletotrichum orbiculare MAFF 240422]
MAENSWQFAVKTGEERVRLRVSRPATPAATQEAGHHHWYLDLEPDYQQSSEDSLFVIGLHEITVARNLLEQLVQQDPSQAIILRLAFAGTPGTIIRPDFLSYRLHDCEEVLLVESFLHPLSHVVSSSPDQAQHVRTSADFASLLQTSVGGLLARSASTSHALRAHLDSECAKRLSIPWTVSRPLARKRVFWVQGRANIDASRQFYQAALALGITLVVLDEPGHWLEDDNGPHAHYREAFLPVSIAADDGLAQRVVDAVRAYPRPVHGVVCISDVRLPLVARACEILGLPTSSSEAYYKAGNKGTSRQVEAAASGRGTDDDGFVVRSAADLDDALAAKQGRLRYPLVVKPCTGWNSDCVAKVRDEPELRAAVVRASQRHASSAARSTSVVVEPYVDGPEIDANFVVLDGAVLFCDVTDDFPCSGDLPGTEGTEAANFMETLMDVPSALPREEKRVMRDALAGSIERLGFRSGVFHCEARVRGSGARYVVDPADGLLDLRVREDGAPGGASCFLHEVNARTPGYINCVAALLAHGVDYYAVRLLLSLGPEGDDRVRALSQPFLHGEPQYVLGISVLAPTKSGVMGSDDAVREFLDANPDLKRHVVHYQTVKEKGEVVQGPDSSELWCVGYVIVASREGRRECLKLDREVRKRFDYKLLEE